MKSLWCEVGKKNKEGTAFAQYKPVTSASVRDWRGLACVSRVVPCLGTTCPCHYIKERLQLGHIKLKKKNIRVKYWQYHVEQLLFLSIKYWIENASISRSITSHSKHNDRSCSNKAIPSKINRFITNTALLF